MEVNQIHTLELLIETISNLIDLYKTNTNQNQKCYQPKNLGVESNPTATSATSPCLPKKSPNLNQVPSSIGESATTPKKTSGDSATAPKKSSGESATDSSGESATHGNNRSVESHGLLAAAQPISAASRGPTVDGWSTIVKVPEIVEIMEFAVSESNQQMQACSASAAEGEETSALEAVWLERRKKRRRRQASALTERRWSTDAPTPSESLRYRKRNVGEEATVKELPKWGVF